MHQTPETSVRGLLMSGCTSSSNPCYTSATACGVPQTNPSANVTPLSLGFGLKQNGADVIVDHCGMVGCVQERNPIGEGYILACDDAGIFKVSFSRLKTLMAPSPVTTPAQPVYRLVAGDAAILLQKDGVTVDTISLCNLVSGCNSGASSNYTLTQQGSVLKLLKGTTVVSTADICAASCAGSSPSYTVTVNGSNVVLNKDGVPVSQVSICPAVTACGGGGGGNTNTAPTAGNATYATLINTAKVTPNLLTLCSDAEGNALTITNVSKPAHGTAVNNAGVVTYTPTTDYVGTDTFTYTVSDGTLTATGTITITVAASGGGGGGGGGNLI